MFERIQNPVRKTEPMIAAQIYNLDITSVETRTSAILAIATNVAPPRIYTHSEL